MNAKSNRNTCRITYDRAYDVLTLRIGEREYNKSIESDNVVLDLDKEGRITGVRIFDAAKMFGIDKRTLKIAVN
jgi:uncharacterized protein YuzE